MKKRKKKRKKERKKKIPEEQVGPVNPKAH